MRYLYLILAVLGSTMSSWTYGQNVRTYIPPQAFTYKPAIQAEIDANFPALPEYNYVPGLIEHESCITLKHKKCWSSLSELKTSREQGVGLGQLTRAFRVDGSTRFDSLANMKAVYRAELKEASWDVIKYRPDLQIRIVLLMIRDDYKRLYSLKDPMVRLQMTDSAYNGGIGDVYKSRRVCGLASGCDPQQWFGHTERYLVKSDRILYGTRSAKDINRHHVDDVFNTKIPKYRSQYFIPRISS